MSDASPSLYGGTPEPPKPKAPGLLDQVAGVFTEPTALFDRLRQSPSWGPATALLTVFGLVLSVVWGLKVDADQMLRPILERNPHVDPSQIDNLVEIQKRFLLPMGIIGALVSTVLLFLLAAFLYWLVGKAMAENHPPTYSQALSAAAVPSLVRLPALLLIILICLLRPIGGLTPEKIAPTSLGFFVSVANLKLQTLLYCADLFLIAERVLDYLALRRITRLKTGGALLCVAVVVLVTVGSRVLGAR